MRWLLALVLIVGISFPIGYSWYGGNSTSDVFDAANDRPSGLIAGLTQRDASQPEGASEQAAPASEQAAPASEQAAPASEQAIPASEDGPASAIATSERPEPSPSGEAVTAAAEVDQAVQAEAPNPSSAATPSGPAQSETAAVEPAEPPAPVKTWVIVIGSRVNVRKDPDLNGQWVTSYVRDTKLQLLERSENWIRIQHPETNETGWMYAEFLRELPPENA